MDFQRSPRLKQAIPRDVVKIHQPPSAPQEPTFSHVHLLVYLFISILVTGLSVLMYYYMNQTRNAAVNPNWFLLPLFSGVVMIIHSVTPFFVNIFEKRAHKKELKNREEKYRQNIQNHEEELRQRLDHLSRVLNQTNPNPSICLERMKERQSTLWERSPHDDDFLDVRLGTGELHSKIPISLPAQEGYDLDPLIEEAQAMAKKFSTVSDVPILLPLKKSGVVGVVGDKSSILNTARGLVLQLATHHSPDEVKLCGFYPEYESNQWDWMRWLPHAWDDQRSMRYLATNKRESRLLLDQLYGVLSRRLGNENSSLHVNTIPNWVFIISDPSLLENEAILPLLLEQAEKIGACILVFANSKEALPKQCTAIVESHGKLILDREFSFLPDQISLEMADEVARCLAPYRLKTSSVPKIPDLLTLFDLWDAKKVDSLDIVSRWNQNRYPNTLPVVVGKSSEKKKVTLNLHDKIERGGQGPHGLIAGTTGSGKSEVIQSIIASLAMNYHPHDLAFLLIDYKGGGMSNTFTNLPHVVGTITNLENSLIERAKVSLKSELARRERIFQKAGNLQHIDEYYQSSWREVQPLPHLVIIIDEFAELKKEQPEFMNELISIAAKGRTLGVHLILATQKPGGVVDDKIWSNSRFRICLRVQGEADSQEMLKIPDAAWITVPGRGYFQVGSNEALELVQFAWSGAPYQPNKSQNDVQVMELAINGQRIIRNAPSLKEESHLKQLNVFIDFLAKEAKQENIESLAGPWLPPLPEELYLDEFQHLRGNTGWNGSSWSQTDTWLNPIVGLVDDPENQDQQPLRIPLNEGHLQVYGMPGTGKTTFVQTLLNSLALDHSPEQLHMYILDFGHMFRDFQELPHVGAIIREDEEDRVKRLLNVLLQELYVRREQMSQLGAKTFSAYRKSTRKQIPAIVVVIDGYLNFRKTYEDENALLVQLLREGGSAGIYFVVTANNLSDIFEQVRSNFSLGVSFEMADPSDYYFAVGRPKAPLLNAPEGRAFVKGSIPPLEFQTAYPTRGTDEIERTKAIREQSQEMKNVWNGPLPKQVKKAPKIITLEELIPMYESSIGSSLQVPVGLSLEDLTPFTLNLQEDPYFVVGSPVGGGKTVFLQTWMLSLAFFTSPEQLEINMIDLRPTFDGVGTLLDLPHVKGYVSTENELEELLKQLEEQLNKREVASFANINQQANTKEPAILLVIDNADYLYRKLEDDYNLKMLLNNIVTQGRGKNFYVVITGSPTDFPQYNSKDWFSEIYNMEIGLLYSTLDPNDLSFFKIPPNEVNAYSGSGNRKVLGPGEGYYSKRRRFSKVKGALPFSNETTPSMWIQQIRDKWSIKC